MTRRLIFTVDVDRDVNIQLDGVAAGSIDRGNGVAPRFSSSEKGLVVIADMLDHIGIKGTFFIEGRTAEVFDCSIVSDHCIGFHGYDHENLAEMENPWSPMETGFNSVLDHVSRPKCFRAPFMSIDDRMYDMLARLGISHDSSVYSDPGTPAYNIGGIIEHPVAKGKDASGRTIAAYTWPMHEGKRSPQDYIELAKTMDDGDLLISTHTWHMVENRHTGVMSDAEAGTNLRNTEAVLTGIMDEGFKPSVMVR